MEFRVSSCPRWKLLRNAAPFGSFVGRAVAQTASAFLTIVRIALAALSNRAIEFERKRDGEIGRRDIYSGCQSGRDGLGIIGGGIPEVFVVDAKAISSCRGHVLWAPGPEIRHVYLARSGLDASRAGIIRSVSGRSSRHDRRLIYILSRRWRI
jgi:hypothetical protein